MDRRRTSKDNVILTMDEYWVSINMLLEVKKRIEAGEIETVPDDKVKFLDNEIMKLIIFTHASYYDDMILFGGFISEIEEEIAELHRQQQIEKTRINLKAERLQRAIQREDLRVIKLLEERKEIEKHIKRVKSERASLWIKVNKIDKKYNRLKAREARLIAAERAAAEAAAAALRVPVVDVPKPRPYLKAVKAEIRNKGKLKVRFIPLPPRIELWVSITVELMTIFFFLFKNKLISNTR